MMLDFPTQETHEQFVIQSKTKTSHVLLHCDPNSPLMCTKRFLRPLAQASTLRAKSKKGTE
jgi:hypothetical protein